MKNRVHEVWPENWPAFNLFARMQTQWSESMNGRTGLRYEAVYPLMERMDLTDDDWNLMFNDIQAMERAALDAMREDD